MSFPLMLAVVAMTILTIAAFAFTVRGLLGVQFSLARLVIAGAIHS